MDCCQTRLFVRKSRVDIEQLQQLLKKAAFWGQHRNLEGLRIAVANSNPVVCAWNGDLMVGFARATSDGIYRAAIWDVLVHPDFQGKNLGTKIVQKISGHPLIKGVERVYLMTSYHQSFYERLGFEVNDTTTMVAFNGKAGAHAQLPIVFNSRSWISPKRFRPRETLIYSRGRGFESARKRNATTKV